MLIAQTEAEELPTVSVNPYFSFGSVTKAVSEMKQHLNEFSNEELVKVAKAGERRGSGGPGEASRGRRRLDLRADCGSAVFTVNKMTFCQLDESKKRLSIKGESAVSC